jgi:YHS domain-containing protein
MPNQRVSTDERHFCSQCQMDGDSSLKTVYKGKNYYFCSQGHKGFFDNPVRFAEAA